MKDYVHLNSWEADHIGYVLYVPMWYKISRCSLGFGIFPIAIGIVIGRHYVEK